MHTFIKFFLIATLALSAFNFPNTDQVRAADTDIIDGSYEGILHKLAVNASATNPTLTAQATEITDTRINFDFNFSWNRPSIDSGFQIRFKRFTGLLDPIYSCNFTKWTPGYELPGDKEANIFHEVQTNVPRWGDNGKILIAGKAISGSATNYSGGTATQTLSFPKNQGKKRVGFWVITTYECKKNNLGPSTIFEFVAIGVAQDAREVDTEKTTPDDGPGTLPAAETAYAPTIVKPNQSDVEFDEESSKFTIPIQWIEPEVIRTDSNPDAKRSQMLSSPNYLILQKRIPAGQSVGDIQFFNQLPLSYSESGANMFRALHSVTLNKGEEITYAFAVKANYKEDNATAEVIRSSIIKQVTLKVNEDGTGETTVENVEERPELNQTEQGEGGNTGTSGSSDCKCDKVDAQDIQKIIEKAICSAICTISKALGNIACFLAGSVVDWAFGGDGRQSCTPSVSDGGAEGVDDPSDTNPDPGQVAA